MTSRSLLHLLIFAWGLNGCSIREQAFVDGGPGKDGIPAIDTPDFNDINIADLSDSSMVLGVYYNGTARAYPTYILRWHEIVNDKFGPFSVAITYSVLAGSSVGFLIPHEFEGIGTSGKLYENNLVMYDRGTDREWVQLLGQRTGSCDFLNRIPLMHTKWGTWRTLHPDSKLLSTRTGYDRDYSVDPYPQYANNEDIYFTTSYRRGSSPYVLHSTKSDCYLLTLSSQTHDQYIFPQSVISEVGSYAYKVFNKSIGPGGDYIQRTYEADYVLDSFGIQPKNNMEIADYLVVVAYHPKDELIAAWMIATNVSMNGTSWEKNFAIINGSTIYNYLGLIPPLKWSFDDYEAEGIFHAFLNISEGFAAPFLGSPDIDKNGTNGYNASLNVEIAGNSTSNYSLNFIKIPVRYNLYRLPLFRSYWFAATAIYPEAHIFVQDGAQFRFETYSPEIIYRQPWRPWMVASIVVLSILALVLFSCTIFCAYHICNRKRFARLNDAEEFVNGSLRDEMKLLIEAGLIDPGQLQSS